LTVSATNSSTRLRSSGSVRRLPGRRPSAIMRTTCAACVRSSVCRCRVFVPCCTRHTMPVCGPGATDPFVAGSVDETWPLFISDVSAADSAHLPVEGSGPLA
jgi:hypothetical protein